MSSFMQDTRDPEENLGLLELLGEGYVPLSRILEIWTICSTRAVFSYFCTEKPKRKRLAYYEEPFVLEPLSYPNKSIKQ